MKSLRQGLSNEHIVDLGEKKLRNTGPHTIIGLVLFNRRRSVSIPRISHFLIPIGMDI